MKSNDSNVFTKIKKSAITKIIADFLFIFKSCQLTNEARAEGKLVCIMPCKEEEEQSQSP